MVHPALEVVVKREINMSSIFVRLGILVVLLQNLQPAFGQLNDCEAFDGPQTGLETYCQDEINKRQYKSIVRNGQRNPLRL